MMEVFAGFLTHTDAQVQRVLDFIDELGELDDTIVLVMSDNGASAEGGAKGSFNEQYFFNFVPESIEENLAAHRRPRHAPRQQPLPLGLGVGRQHAAQAVQARHPRGRRRRPAHRALARAARRRRHPAPVRARHRRHADAARPDRHRAAGGDRRHRAVADRGRELRQHPRRRRRAQRRTSRSTTRCSARGRSTTTAGSRSCSTPRRSSPTTAPT